MQITDSDTPDRETRVRLDDVLVELSTDSPAEAFEADVLNVGPGGLAVRSPLLPDVGSRLSCSFASPFDGSAIHADCEVVWASDQGPHHGEFGLRFERLSGECAESLRRLVEAEDRLLSPSEARDLGWSAPPLVDPSIIGLSLDGVASELVAEVRHDDDDALVAEQELPFLRLGTGVTTEDGRRGVLRSVELRVENDLPRLVLTITYDADDASDDSGEIPLTARAPTSALGAWARGDTEAAVESPEYGDAADADADEDDADAGDADDAYAPVDGHSEGRADEALATHGGYRGLDDETSDGEPSHDADGDADAALDAYLDHDTIPDDHGTGDVREKIAARAPARTARPSVVPSLAPKEAPSRVREMGEPVLAKASGVAAAVKDATSDRLSSAMPVVRDGLDRARKSAVEVAGNVGTRAVASTRASFAQLSRFASLLADKTRAEAPTHDERPRRVQRRPDDRGPETEAATPAGTKLKGRHFLVGGLALVVAALAAHGVLNAPDSAAPAIPAAAPSTQTEPEEGSSLDVAPSAPTTAPTPSGADLGSVAPTVPTVSTPAYAAGPIPAPTYPSVGGVPPASAVAAGLGSGGASVAAPATSVVRHFGDASVPGGIPFELMMNMPIESIAGTATADGFTVRIARSTSATRAGPIAEQHPDVERASITNADGNSELRIQWKPGRHPRYRVEANGNRLRVLIGR